MIMYISKFGGRALSTGARRQRVGEHDHPAVDVAERPPPAPERATRGSEGPVALNNVVPTGEKIRMISATPERQLAVATGCRRG